MIIALAKVKSYRRSFAKHGVSHKALQWVSKDAAERRYVELVADIDFEGKSILDVGCGFGDIIPFIEDICRKFEYTGIDIVPEFVEAARKKHPDHDLHLGDYLNNPVGEVFDIVISSGTLNSNVENAIEKRKTAIKLMYDHASEVLVFNMAGSHPQPKSKEGGRVYYADSLEILDYCLGLTPKVIFRHHYHPKDFTIIMFK